MPRPVPRPPLASDAALPPVVETPPAPVEDPAVLAAACTALAESGVAIAARVEAVEGAGACGIVQPVRLAAVRLAEGGIVALEPVAVLRCDMALAVARWIREDVAPDLTRTIGSKLETVKVAGSYDCRGRNRVVDAKMSEHGRGNAMDTRGYVLEDGREILVGDRSMPGTFQTTLRASACTRFKTVLGPGSDGYHEEHLHVDLAPRRNGGAICDWKIDQTARN